jgi:carbonic anhydrase
VISKYAEPHRFYLFPFVLVFSSMRFVQILRPYRLEESVREDLDFLRSEPLIRQEIKDNAKGYVYDIKTGKLNPVGHEP